VVWKHSLRNAFIAPLTYFAIIIGAFFTGTMAVETVFAWPGVGQLAVNSVFARDFPTLQAVVIIGSAIYVSANMLVDIFTPTLTRGSGMHSEVYAPAKRGAAVWL
jgi:peptide/nickel transport system permease protein